MAVALIVAAGRGERLGIGGPKALVPIAGRSMLDWSLESLARVAALEAVVVALPVGVLHRAPAGVAAVAGGAVRSQSVREALRASAHGDPVLVHDAARPLASSWLFERCLHALEAADGDVAAVVAAVPVTDTVKQVAGDGRTVERTLERASLRAVQTPQVFRRAALAGALEHASDTLLAQASDDAWLIEQAGGRVEVVEGEAENIKVTTPADLRLAEQILAARMRKVPE